MRHTKIVATIGPASQEENMLRALIAAGVNVFRLNFSHGTHEWHGQVMQRIKNINKTLDQKVAILLDTKGPEIRTGDVKKPILLEKGKTIVLTIDAADAEARGKVGVSYRAFIQDAEVGEEILVDGGVMRLRVLKKTKTDVHCEVLDGGELKSRRHLNLPGKHVSLPSITEGDWADIQFGIEQGIDFIALSFVRKADEIEELKDFLKRKKSTVEVIAKIECVEATKHLTAIVEASDGVMVARGDLGAEVHFAKVPRLQREIIETCKQFQKPVIVATQMLESMMMNPMPTRAEVTDVSTAVFQRADAIMLSGETAGGAFPIRTVEAMVEIAQETEGEFLPTRSIREIVTTTEKGEFAKRACQMAGEIRDIAAIVVMTRTGFMARQVSSFRPRVPIYAFTNTSSTLPKLSLLWGVKSYEIVFCDHPEDTIVNAQKAFLKKHPEWKGKRVVLVADSLVNGEFIPTLQIRSL